MNIASSVKESSTEISTIDFYVNIDFDELVHAIDNGVLSHNYNGQGRKIVYIPEDLESQFLSYADSHGKATPPFEIKVGDFVNCVVREQPDKRTEAKFKWHGIVQTHFNLKQIGERTDSKTQVTYQAQPLPAGVKVQDDSVTIQVKFSLNGNKYQVSWDPKVLVRDVTID